MRLPRGHWSYTPELMALHYFVCQIADLQGRTLRRDCELVAEERIACSEYTSIIGARKGFRTKTLFWSVTRNWSMQVYR